MYNSTPSSNVLIDQVIGAYQISGNQLFLEKIIRFYAPKIETVVSTALGRNGVYRIPYIEKSDYVNLATLAFIKTLSRVDTTNPRFEAYLMRRVYGAVLDELRVRGPYKRSAAENGKSKPQMISLDDTLAKTSPDESPENLAIVSERDRVIENVISELPGREKAAIIAYFYIGMTDRNIADSGIMGDITENRANQIRHRAQRMLAEKLSSLN